VFTLSEGFADKSEVEEADEEHVELLEAGEDSAEALQPSEQPFDLVAFLVEGAVVLLEPCRDRAPVAASRCLHTRDP
jgi:hypothetical protein